MRVRIKTSNINKLVRDMNREVDKQVKRGLQRIERELQRKVK